MAYSFSGANHTFVVCAYKTSPYLESAIDSLKRQTVKSAIVVSTSTPNEHIEEACNRQGVPLIVNPNKRSIGDDWNYGYDSVNTPLVTIAHQDDRYEPDFLEIVLDTMNESNMPPGITFTDYYELRSDEMVLRSVLLDVKRIMSQPFVLGRAHASRFV